MTCLNRWNIRMPSQSSQPLSTDSHISTSTFTLWNLSKSIASQRTLGYELDGILCRVNLFNSQTHKIQASTLDSLNAMDYEYSVRRDSFPAALANVCMLQETTIPYHQVKFSLYTFSMTMIRNANQCSQMQYAHNHHFTRHRYPRACQGPSS